MPELPPSLLRLFGRGARTAEEARAASEGATALRDASAARSAARLPETVAPLRSGATSAGDEVAATRQYRQTRLAQHEAAQTTLPHGTNDTLVMDRSRLRDVREPSKPLFSPETRSNLARAGAYTALGLGGVAVAAAVGDYATSHILTPISQNKVNEANAQTPQVSDAGLCAKIVRAPGQSTLLDDAECRAEKMREFLNDPGFSDAYRQYVLDRNPDQTPGSVNVSSVTTAPPSFAQKLRSVAISVALLSLVGAGAYAGWRYYKAHPEKFHKHAGTRVPTITNKPSASPA